MKPVIKVVPQTSEHGSCHYCQRGKLKEGFMGLEYPFSKIICIEGTHVTTNFCPDCFEEVIRFGLPKASDSTASPSEAEAVTLSLNRMEDK